MRKSSLQLLQIFCLVIGIIENADAQTTGYIKPSPVERPAPYPGRPITPPRDTLATRESTHVIELGASGTQRGTRRLRDITREVLSKATQPMLTSLVFLASSEQGNGDLDLYINRRPVLRNQEQLPMKRKAIQVDLNYSLREIRSIEVETSGHVLIHSITVNSSQQRLPSLDSNSGEVIHRPPVIHDVCDIATAGVANGVYSQYRIILKGQAIDGANDLIEISRKLGQLEQAGICRRPSEGQCSLASAGTVNGRYVRLSIKRNNVAFAGADTMDEVLEVARMLQDDRLCHMAVHKCELTTAGTVSSGQYFKHRLMINGQALAGANDLGTLLSQVNELRRQNICQ